MLVRAVLLEGELSCVRFNGSPRPKKLHLGRHVLRGLGGLRERRRGIIACVRELRLEHAHGAIPDAASFTFGLGDGARLLACEKAKSVVVDLTDAGVLAPLCDAELRGESLHEEPEAAVKHLVWRRHTGRAVPSAGHSDDPSGLHKRGGLIEGVGDCQAADEAGRRSQRNLGFGVARHGGVGHLREQQCPHAHARTAPHQGCRRQVPVHDRCRTLEPVMVCNVDGAVSLDTAHVELALFVGLLGCVLPVQGMGNLPQPGTISLRAVNTQLPWGSPQHIDQRSHGMNSKTHRRTAADESAPTSLHLQRRTLPSELVRLPPRGSASYGTLQPQRRHTPALNNWHDASPSRMPAAQGLNPGGSSCVAHAHRRYTSAGCVTPPHAGDASDRGCATEEFLALPPTTPELRTRPVHARQPLDPRRRALTRRELWRSLAPHMQTTTETLQRRRRPCLQLGALLAQLAQLPASAADAGQALNAQRGVMPRTHQWEQLSRELPGQLSAPPALQADGRAKPERLMFHSEAPELLLGAAHVEEALHPTRSLKPLLHQRPVSTTADEPAAMSLDPRRSACEPQLQQGRQLGAGQSHTGEGQEQRGEILIAPRTTPRDPSACLAGSRSRLYPHRGGPPQLDKRTRAPPIERAAHAGLQPGRGHCGLGVGELGDEEPRQAPPAGTLQLRDRLGLRDVACPSARL
mmetsp:Transcript_85649/g.247269  ORF Transcript_85649/g.247269 Transcript_85649/m.247269 type:complete len:690 (-) Transcript_85649:475-2544(-)